MDEESVKPCIQDRLRARTRNINEWFQENSSVSLLGFSFLIALFIFFFLKQYWPSFFPEYIATGLGVLMGASLALDQIKGREERAHDKFLRDIYIELKKNSNHLTSHGYILNTYIWDSGISSGSILVIDSKELDELSEIYHKIETNVYEAKICRQAAEKYRSLPQGREKKQAHENWNGLSNALHRREPILKRQIDDFLKKDLWEKAGVDKAHK